MMPDDAMCAEYRNWLAAYAAGVVPATLRTQIEEHLAHCERCSRELEQWQRIGRVARESVRPAPPSDFNAAWNHLAQQLRPDQATDTHRPSAESPLLRDVLLGDFETNVALPNHRYPQRAIPPQSSSLSFMQAIGAVAACAVIVTLLVVVFVTFQHPHLTRSTLHTAATPVVMVTPTGPGHPLLWAKITPPAGVVLDSLDTYIFQADSIAHMLNTSVPHAWLSVAPSNGNVAYICQTRPDNTTHIWRTEDAGAHWTALPYISKAGEWPVCDVLIDENDPLTVFITLSDPSHYHYPGLSPALLTDSGPAYVLLDGATRWQSTSPYIWAIASSHGSYYAIIGSANGPAHLYSSTDLQLWHKIDSSAWPTEGLGGVSGNPLPPAPQLWVQPETGVLLVILSNNSGGTMWTSSDRGDHWQEIAYPSPLATNGYPTALLQYVEPPKGSEPFHICIRDVRTGVALATPTGEVLYFYCTHDGGQSWVQRFVTLSWPKGANPGVDCCAVPYDATLADGSVTVWGGIVGSNMIYRLSVDDSHTPASTFLGTTPETPPVNRNAPMALFGLSPQGGVFWEPVSSQAVYVTQLTT
jgi:Putative zinc-finger